MTTPRGRTDPSIAGLDFAVGGLQAIGLRSPRPGVDGPAGARAQSFLDQHGEGSSTIGFLVDDLDQTQRAVRALGIDFVHPEALPARTGRLNLTEPVHGIRLQFAQHDPGAAKLWG